MTPPVIDKNTPITLGLVILVLGVSATAIFKAGQVLTEFDYVKTSTVETKTSIVRIEGDIAELKRGLNDLNRQQRNAGSSQKTYQ